MSPDDRLQPGLAQHHCRCVILEPLGAREGPIRHRGGRRDSLSRAGRWLVEVMLARVVPKQRPENAWVSTATRLDALPQNPTNKAPFSAILLEFLMVFC